MKKLLLFTVLIFLLQLSYSQCGCTKIVFIVDNSGSISSTEFTDMKKSMDSISDRLFRTAPGAKMSVIQYATDDPSNHVYHITVPFTSNPSTAKTWSRAYGSGGTVNSGYYQDHLPGSLETMRSAGIWGVGGGTDLITDSCEIRMFLFTDAGYGSGTSCCSNLSNNGQATSALVNYGEYNLHKSTYNSVWTVYHVTTSSTSMSAGAAISSKGGAYTGVIDTNSGDPEGPGVPRKYYTFSNFNLSSADIDTAIANINAGGFFSNFVFDTVCIGDSTHFFATNSSIPSYVEWDFGDGSKTYFNLSPAHKYSTAGTYTTRLITWSADSICKDTIYYPIIVYPKPIPKFLADTICISYSTSFTNLSTGIINSQIWKFGDGNSDTTSPHTIHRFSSPGNYQTTLLIKSSNHCFDSITKTVIVDSLRIHGIYDTTLCSSDSLILPNGKIITASGVYFDTLTTIGVPLPICDTLFHEDFEGVYSQFTLNTSDLSSISPGYDDNAWIINNSYAGGSYFLLSPVATVVPATPNQNSILTGSTNSRYMHIYSKYANYNSISNCNYMHDVLGNVFYGQNGTNFTRMTNNISTLGKSNVSFEMYYLCAADSGRVYYSLNSGVTWNLLSTLYDTSWTSYSISSPIFNNQANLNLLFLLITIIQF